MRPFDVGAPLGIDLRIGPDAGRRERAVVHVARGRSATATPHGVARIVRYETPRLAALATLRARALASGGDGAGGPIAASHLRYVERRGRERRLVLFLVDASGSMAAAARMRAAKGAICALLEDAYHRRDAVALVAFSGSDARVLVPPTRSAGLAYRRLRDLAVGGRTPLAAGLREARDVLARHARRESGARAHLVVVSDARATMPVTGAFEAALLEADVLRRAAVRTLCIDTEVGRIRLGLAQRLSAALAADYRRLEDCSERALGAAVREWMATAS